MDMLIVLLILCLFVQQLMSVLSNKSLAFKKIQYSVYIIVLSFIAICAKAKYQSKVKEDSERENVIFFLTFKRDDWCPCNFFPIRLQHN